MNKLWHKKTCVQFTLGRSKNFKEAHSTKNEEINQLSNHNDARKFVTSNTFSKSPGLTIYLTNRINISSWFSNYSVIFEIKSVVKNANTYIKWDIIKISRYFNSQFTAKSREIVENEITFYKPTSQNGGVSQFCYNFYVYYPRTRSFMNWFRFFGLPWNASRSILYKFSKHLI